MKTLLDIEQSSAPLIATSRAVANLPGLTDLLGMQVVYRWKVWNLAACRGVIGWGCKPSTVAAAKFADRHRLGLLRLEDGFLRSVCLGKEDPPFSIVLDDLGIYYDASGPSRLEALIANPLTEMQQSRAQMLVGAWRTARVSKYNHAREFTGKLPLRYVLVVDQTLGDASIHYGLADGSSFQRMLDAALAENPDSTVLLKVHPEVMAGRKRGHFDLPALAQNPRVRVLGEDLHPAALIEHADAMYVVTSQMGFEGLLWGKRVRTFGMPFYAGWGLTDDELAAPERRKPVALESLVHAALVDYPRYLDPETNTRCQVERLIEWLGLQRRMRERFPATIYAMGFSIYKKSIVRRFFQGSSVRFVRRVNQVPDGSQLAVWGRKVADIPSPSPLPGREGIKRVRLEDGFLRSVGLGADLVRPLSWVMDGLGIYYDASQPSDLEHILQGSDFDGPLIVRAQALRERLVAGGLTKYNVGSGRWRRPYPGTPAEDVGGALKVILVPGQVESDASLAFGAPCLRRNLDMLRAVRAANADAYVIYKPHPDVVAGLRCKGYGEEDAAQWCNEVVEDVSMGELLQQVDEVHVLTSLAGFEALLRGKKVVCYGQPFYAGWGLTEDVVPVTRRTRILTLDELVAGVLFLYPVYVSRATGRFTSPERTLEELQAWQERSASVLPWWRKGLRWVLGVARS